jgi:ribose transport system ATP-binding protein
MLAANNLSKRFGGVVALDGVSLNAHAGEVLAVVGENGAGKSTLMKILAGVHRPDAGDMRLDGRPYQPVGVRDALAAGVVLIHQELNLAGPLSVAANLFLGREPSRFGWLDRRAMAGGARDLLRRVGLDVPVTRPVGALPIGQQQLVEIARALALDASVLIMDEPTSSLSQADAERLFTVIHGLKRAGVTTIYISHRLAEVRAIADRVTVLRDGRNAGELGRGAIHIDAIVRLMVGRDLRQFYARKHSPPPDAPRRLELRGVRGVSFSIRAGEIVGLAGLVGAGRTELAEAVFGVRPFSGGQIVLDGVPVRIRSPRDAMRHGVLLVPEDRRRHGLILADSVRRNVSLPNLDRLNRLGFVSRPREQSLARRTVEALRVKTPSVRQPVGLLSGGNQQKVVFGKWLACGPKVLLLDEPTRGVDVGAKAEIYALVDELAGTGVAVLMISSDLEEVLGVADRVLVMHQGRLVGELTRGEASEPAVMRLATGGG